MNEYETFYKPDVLPDMQDRKTNHKKCTTPGYVGSAMIKLCMH